MDRFNTLDERTSFFIMRFFNRCHNFKVVETIYADNYTKQVFSNGILKMTYTLKPKKSMLFVLSVNDKLIASKECYQITDVMNIFDTFDKIIGK